MDQSSATRQADRIRELNESWLAASRRKDLDGMMAIYAPDAQELPPGQPAVVGRDAIRELYRQLITDFPRFNHMFALDEVTIAESGDLAVVRGSGRLLGARQRRNPDHTGQPLAGWAHPPGGLPAGPLQHHAGLSPGRCG